MKYLLPSVFFLMLLGGCSTSPETSYILKKNVDTSVTEQKKKVELARKRRLYIDDIRKADYLALRNHSAQALGEYLGLMEKIGKDATLEKKIAEIYYDDKNWSKAHEYFSNTIYTDLTQEDQDKYIQSVLFDEQEKDARSRLEALVTDSAKLEYYKITDTCHTTIHNCIIAIMASTNTGTRLMSLREITSNYSKISADYQYRNMLVAAKFFEQGMYRASMVLSEEILKHRPDYKEAIKILGFSYLKMGKYEKARDTLTSYLEIFPKDVDTIVALGETYFTLGDYTLSNLYFNNAVLTNYTDKIYIERRLAYNYIMLDDFDSALKVIYYILKRENAEEDDFIVGSSLAGLDSEWIRAFAWTTEGLKKYPDSSSILTERARALRNLGKYSEAFETVNQALTLTPENTKAQAEKAILLYYTSDIDTANAALVASRAKVSETALQSELDEYISLTSHTPSPTQP